MTDHAAETVEPTIDQRVAMFEEAGNGPEATAEYRASLERDAADEADVEEVLTADAAEVEAFNRAAVILRSGSSTEQKFAAIAKLFDDMAANW